MKTNWLILGTMIATSAVAQVNTNKLPEIPPPASTLPAPASGVKPIEHKTHAKKTTERKAKKNSARKNKTAVKSEWKKMAAEHVTLIPGAATVDAENVNLRGQAGLKGEVVGQVKKGDTINVLSEITLDKPKAGEPAQWAKISLPSGTKVWIDSKFVDKTAKTVGVKKLNLRGGPGENYSVLGVLEKGEPISEITSKGDWMQIEAPTNAFAFIDASYLKQQGPGVEPNVLTQPTVAAVEPTTTTVTEPQSVAPPAANPPVPEPTLSAAPTAPSTTSATALAAMNVPPPLPTLAVDTNLPPPPPRVVTHEGTVHRSVSPVAPTYYELDNPATGVAVNYLFSPTTNLDLARYNGLHINVTGEEGLDSRWKDTPVLTIQKIYVLSAPDSKPKKHSWF